VNILYIMAVFYDFHGNGVTLMSYNIDLAKIRQKQQIEQFKLGKTAMLVIPKISKIPGKIYSDRLNIYSKKELKTSVTEAVHIIEKNGKFKTLIYHAGTDSIKKLKRLGVIPTETPLSQAINKLSEYRQIVLNRAYETHKITSLYKEKLSLLDFSQDLLEILEPIECMVNTLDGYRHEQQKSNLQFKINRVIIELAKYKKLHHETLSPLSAFDRNILRKMETLYGTLEENLNAISNKIERASFEDLKTLLKSTGPNAIHTQVKHMGMAIITKTQELNQNLVYSRKAKSFFRGELHDACENALQAIQSYEADPHHPILTSHQGNFDDITETLAIDFSELDEEKAKRAIYAINEISGYGIHYKDGEYLLNGIPLTAPAPDKKRTTWRNFSIGNLFNKIGVGLKTLIQGVASFLISLVIDLPIAFITALFTFDLIKSPSLSTFLFPYKHQNNATSLIKDIFDSCSFKRISFGSIKGRQLALLAINVLKDIGRSFMDVMSRLALGFYDILLDVQIQFKKGERTEQCKNSLADIKSSLIRIQEKNTHLFADFEKKEKSLRKQNDPQNAPSICITSTHIADVPYHLSSGEWTDILNLISDQVKASLDNGITYSLAKHPFRTNLILLIQIGAMLSLAAPTALPLVTKIYTQLFSLLKEAIPQPVLNVITQITSNDAVQYLQGIDMLESTMGINQPMGINSADYKPYHGELNSNLEGLNLSKELMLQIELFQILIIKKDLLQYFSHREKRAFLMVAEELFKDIKNKKDFIKGISGLLYPSTKKTSLNRTLIIITDYIPLLVRCLLSPITCSLRPWHELGQKIIKDVTRVLHALSRLCNTLFNMIVRVLIRAPGDIFVNEIAARAEGAIRNDEHNVSQISYLLSQHCNKTTEGIRQTASIGVDIMRHMSNTPAQQTTFQNVSSYLHSHGFFAQEKEQDISFNSPDFYITP
jgi:hypothetical protein